MVSFVLFVCLFVWSISFCFSILLPLRIKKWKVKFPILSLTKCDISEGFVISSSIVVCFLWLSLMCTLTCCNHTASAGGYGTVPIRLCSFPTTVCYVCKVYWFFKIYGYNCTFSGLAYTTLSPHSTGWWNSGSEITFRHLQTSCTGTNKLMLLQFNCFWHCKKLKSRWILPMHASISTLFSHTALSKCSQ